MKDLPLKVINLWTGPGAGKSTTAAGVFNLMKNAGLQVELVTEVAKDMTYGHRWKDLENQLLVLALQDQRQRQLVGKVDWVITDSPLPLGIAYLPEEYQGWLEEAIMAAYDRYDNYDFLLRRVKPYQTYGRNQTEAEALALDITIRDLWQQATANTVYGAGPGGIEDPVVVGIEQENAWEIEASFDAPYRVLEALDIPEFNTWLAARFAKQIEEDVYHGGV